MAFRAGAFRMRESMPFKLADGTSILGSLCWRPSSYLFPTPPGRAAGGRRANVPGRSSVGGYCDHQENPKLVRYRSES